MSNKTKWALDEINEHIKINNSRYGLAVVAAALFLKLYGVLPKISLTEAQAGHARALASKLLIFQRGSSDKKN